MKNVFHKSDKCDDCAHREICSVKSKRELLEDKLHGINQDFDEFSICVECKHYLREIEMVSTRLPCYDN